MESEHWQDTQLDGSLDGDGDDTLDDTPPRAMVMSIRSLALSNGRLVHVKVVRPEDAKPWSEDDETALRAILDVAAGFAAATPLRTPRLLS